MLMDQSSVNAKPPSLHPSQGQLTASGAGLRPYNMSQTYHALPPEAARSVTANIQVSCDKLTHQLCSDVDFLMQQMIKTIDDAKHHLKMAVYTLGKHLHDGVMDQSSKALFTFSHNGSIQPNLSCFCEFC